MKITKSISTLATAAVLGSIIGGFSRYLLNVIVGNYLGPEALGLFSIGIVIMSIGGTIGRAGLDNSVQRFVPAKMGDNDADDASKDVYASLFITMCVSVFIMFLGIHIIYYFDLTKESLTELEFFIFSIPLFAIMWVAIKSTIAVKETKYQVYIRDIAQSVTAVLALFVVSAILKNQKLIGAGYFLSLLFGCVLSLYYVTKIYGFEVNKSVFQKTRFQYLLTYSLPLLIVAVTQYLISWTDVLMLSVLTSTSDIGIYQAAFQTAAVLSMVLQGINSIFPPIASELYHNNKRAKLYEIFSSLTKWGTYIATIGFLYMGVFSEQILSVLFGADFTGGSLALITLAVGQLMAVAAGPAGYLLSMSDREKVESVNTVAVSLVNVILNYVLIDRYGVLGAAIATAISLILLNIIRSVEVYYIYNIFPINRNYWKGGVALLASFIVLLVFNWIEFVPVIIIMAAPVAATGCFVIVIYTLGIDETDKLLIESV